MNKHMHTIEIADDQMKVLDREGNELDFAILWETEYEPDEDCSSPAGREADRQLEEWSKQYDFDLEAAAIAVSEYLYEGTQR